MKTRYVLWIILWACLSPILKAMDIPAGTFYFDNTRTQYAVVKFVYGSDSRPETYVRSMVDEGDGVWSIHFDEKVSDMYRYTFAATSMEDGLVSETFPDVKEYISKMLNEYRTATSSATILVGGTFVPSSGENWAQGTWIAGRHVADTEWSGTLPLLFINTDTGNDITSKENYVTATYWLDNMGIDSVPSLGSKAEPLTLKIRGRGNWTWSGFEKKPYRVKLDAKRPLAGLNNARNFCLQPHADDDLGFLRDEVGFELSRRLRMIWTPETYPVELVINGNYRGLYFVTEPVRIGANHVNIMEQSDLCTDPDSITGGWLVELDNYEDSNQISFKESNGDLVRVTYHSPELLSSAQRNYLTTQMQELDAVIYTRDKGSTTWEERIDKEALVRYYIVQELMEDTESFHGSSFFYKDWGDTCKWTWGPVWDFGNAFRLMANRFIYDRPQFGQTWIGEMSKWESFQSRVREVWQEFLGHSYPTLSDWVEERGVMIAPAAISDAARWPSYGQSDMMSKVRKMQQNLEWRISWLKKQWGELEQGITTVEEDEAQSNCIYDLNGRRVEKVNRSGVYVVNGRKVWLEAF